MTWSPQHQVVRQTLKEAQTVNRDSSPFPIVGNSVTCIYQCLWHYENIIVQVIFYLLWNHWAHSGYFESRIPLKPALRGVCSLANYSVAYEETQSTSLRFSWFCVFFFFKGNSFVLLCLFKCIENFTTNSWKFSDKKSDILHISAQTRLWVLVRTASMKRF